MDILTNLAIFAFVLVAILMGSVRAISIGAVALVINSCVSVSWLKFDGILTFLIFLLFF